MNPIGKVAVIGAGVMGAGIAAQVANAGFPALLLDMTEELAVAAHEKLRVGIPAAYMHPSAETLVTARGLENGLSELSTCDWIIEAIIEKADVKRSLYRRIAPWVAGHAAISSNTSTICRADLVAEMPAALADRFLITHFFNPPRTMRLLEVVAAPDTDKATSDAVIDFADRALGKTVVRCRDRPGFIANRLGCFWMQVAMLFAVEQGLTVEEADAVMGNRFGIPKTGVFGLADLVGVDLMPSVNASLAAALESDDLFQTVNRPIAPVERMIAVGLTGRKSGGGFYRQVRDPGHGREALDFVSLAYRPMVPVGLPKGEGFFGSSSRLDRYGTAVMARTLAYAGHLVGDAAEDAVSIDEAMRLGYNWRWGPFELADRIGLDLLRGEIASTGVAVPPFLARAGSGPIHRGSETITRDGTYARRPQPMSILSLADVRACASPVIEKGGLSLWSIGEGIFCLEFASPGGLMGEGALDAIDAALDHVAEHGHALVVSRDGAEFSADAEFQIIASFVRGGDWRKLAALIVRGQVVLERLKQAPFPTVAAISGTTIGSGLEVALRCTAIQAHAESSLGYLEASVGLIPPFGGCCELLWRAGAAMAGARAMKLTFDQLASSRLSRSAAVARDMCYVRPSDGITMNSARLLADARTRAVNLARDWKSGAGTMLRPLLTVRDGVVPLAGEEISNSPAPAANRAIARLISLAASRGGDATALKEMLAATREEFFGLVKLPEALARLEAARGQGPGGGTRP